MRAVRLRSCRRRVSHSLPRCVRPGVSACRCSWIYRRAAWLSPLMARLPNLATRSDAPGSANEGKREGWIRLCGVAQAGQEGIDAVEQRGGVPAELAGGDEDVVGQPAGLVGGLTGACDVGRDFGGARRGLLHASRNLARRRILFLDGGGNGGRDPADLADGVADAADRDDAIAGGGLDRGDLAGDFLGRFRGLTGEFLDLGRDDRKSPAGFAGTRSE